jgi:multidrug efflux pump subunit AcrB
MERLRALISNRQLARIAFAVLVVEAIYYGIDRGQQALQDCLDAIAEAWTPVLSSVATTLTAFPPTSATLEQTLARTLSDTAAANAIIASKWEKIRARHPGISLDLSGELEDIEESLAARQTLFLLGVGIMDLILAAQFASYWQPLVILVTVPLLYLAFIRQRKPVARASLLRRFPLRLGGE